MRKEKVFNTYCLGPDKACQYVPTMCLSICRPKKTIKKEGVCFFLPVFLFSFFLFFLFLFFLSFLSFFISFFLLFLFLYFFLSPGFCCCWTKRKSRGRNCFSPSFLFAAGKQLFLPASNRTSGRDDNKESPLKIDFFVLFLRKKKKKE